MERWTWDHYRMDGQPIITLEDYTISGYGRAEEIGELVQRIASYAKQSARLLLRLVQWWGSGKSTFLYNVCDQVNKSLFFEDQLEDPERGVFRHVIALYQKVPLRRRELLEFTYENGLPLVWSPGLAKEEIVRKRKNLWLECVRKLSFILLRKATREIVGRGLEQEAIRGSAIRKEFLEKLKEFSTLKTRNLITKLDELYTQDERVFDEIGELLRYYIQMLMPSIEERVARTKVVKQEDFEIEFPKLLYSCNTGNYLGAYRKLFGSPDTNLRRFTAFEKILKEANTFAFVVMDEVEDWSKVVKDKIDFDLHDIYADAESAISMILVFRTEVLGRIRSASALERYSTLLDRLFDISIGKWNKKEIEEVTAAILATARGGRLDTFPCSQEFVLGLAERTKRSGEFNVRSYIRSLIEILPKSLEWERKDVQLTPDLLDREEALAIISRVSEEEERRASVFKPPEVEE